MNVTRWQVKCIVGDLVVATSVEAATTKKAAIAKLKHRLRDHVVTNAGAIRFEASEVDKGVYSVTFEYKGADGEWRWSYDHRCEAADEDSAVNHWRSAGYGEIRNATARRLA